MAGRCGRVVGAPGPCNGDLADQWGVELKVMRRAARVDANHKEIADGLRAIGRSVLSLHRLGQDAPDLLVGNGDHNILVEVKTAKGKLSDGQKAFFEWWRGPRAVVRSLEEAIEATSPKH
jgi:hypothetical protein